MNRIKRPLAGLAIVYLSGDICAMADNLIITVMVSLSISIWLTAAVLQKRYNPICFSLIIFFLMAYSLASQQLEPNLISSYIEDETSGISVEIVGFVDKIQEKEAYTQITLKDNTVTLPSKSAVSLSSKGILVNVNEYRCDIGDTIRVKGTLKEFPVSRNTGGFDSKFYYNTINIEYRCTGEITEIIEKNDNEILSMLNTFKKKLKASYASIANEKDAGLYNSIVLGDTQELQEGISDLYKDNGVAHLLAISGMQISMIGMLLYKMLRKTGIQFLPCAAVSLAVVIAYGIIAGNGVSTIRAVIMFAAAVGAGVFGRTYDVLSATSLAAVLILLDSPTMFLNCGFLLSFCAILGMVLIAPIINKAVYPDDEEDSKNKMLKYKMLKYLFLSASMSFSINLATLPVILYFYFQIPMYSVLINIILIPLMAFVMISAGCGGLLGMMFMTLGIFGVGLAHYILAFYEAVCIWFLKLPYAIVIVGQPSVFQIIIYYVILLIMLVIIHMATAKTTHKVSEEKAVNRKDKRRTFLCVCGLMVLMTAVICYRNHEGLEISMIDVGQGDSIFVRTPQNTTYLFDGGSSDVKKAGEYRIVPFLKSNGIQTIDYIVVSHMDTDHINGITEILADENCFNIRIKNVVLPQIPEKDKAYLALEQTIADKGINIRYVNANDEFGDESVSVKCLHPSMDFRANTTNGYSTTVSLSFKKFDMLFTGDLEKAGEDILMEEKRLKDIEVLKVAHHGSKYSSQQRFLECIRPEISLISCGINNRFGHPHKELISRLESIKSRVLITSECGEIKLYTDGYSVEFERFLKTK